MVGPPATMRYASTILLALAILAGCDSRDGDDAIAHGMKWTIAQRTLEQNGWTSTVTKPSPSALQAGRGGKAYRYQSAAGVEVDILTEEVGDIEKIYRLFDADGRELETLRYRE